MSDWLNGWYRNEPGQRAAGQLPSPASSAQSAGQNWLIAGSDSRQGLSRQQIDTLPVGAGLRDRELGSIMLLHMGGGRPVLISIPRDSYVPIPGHGTNKMNVGGRVQA